VVEPLRSEPGNDTKVPSTSEYQRSYKVGRSTALSTDMFKSH